MHQKVAQTINGNTKTNRNQKVIEIHHPQHDKKPTGNSKNQEKNIIFFKKPGFVLMVISVKIPSQTMHYKFMHEPGHKLHPKEGCYTYKNVNSNHASKLVDFTLSKQAKVQIVQ